MSETARQIVDLIDMLPVKEQELAYQFVKRVVLAWDSDFTKLTESERAELVQSEIDFNNGDTFKEGDINWK